MVFGNPLAEIRGNLSNLGKGAEKLGMAILLDNNCIVRQIIIFVQFVILICSKDFLSAP